MIFAILISAGLAYFLALPFSSVLQGGGYRFLSILRAKKYLVICVVYGITAGVAESMIVLFTSTICAALLTTLLYIVTGCIVLFIHRAMGVSYHFTRRLIRLLVAFFLLYILVFVWLYCISFHGLWATLPAFAPLLLLATNALLAPFERMNNRKYIERASARLDASSALKIGITGSYGKTSVKHYIERLFSSRFNTLASPENYNTPMGIAKTLDIATGKEEVYVLEMGARRRGDIAELCDIVHPDLGVITGIAPQHLETFHTIEEVMTEKQTLAGCIPSEKTVFYNLTDPLVRQLYEDRTGKKVGVGYHDAEYVITEEKFDSEGSTFVLTHDGGSVKIVLSCVGKASVIDFALAAVVAAECGVSWEYIVEAAKRATPPPHRFEVVKRGSVTVIDDSYNINPVGAAVSLESLRMFKGLRKVVYTSGIVELGSEEERYNHELGKHVSEVASVAVICKGRYGDLVAQGIDERVTTLYRVENTAEATELFSSILGDGDVLLIMSDLPRDYLL